MTVVTGAGRLFQAPGSMKMTTELLSVAHFDEAGDLWIPIAVANIPQDVQCINLQMAWPTSSPAVGTVITSMNLTSYIRQLTARDIKQEQENLLVALTGGLSEPDAA
jgi:hypothetical protein